MTEIIDFTVRPLAEIKRETEEMVQRLPEAQQRIWNSWSPATDLSFFYPEGEEPTWAIEGTIDGQRYGCVATEAVAQDRQAAEAKLRRAAEAVRRQPNPFDPAP